MTKDWVVEIYTNRCRKWMQRYGFAPENARYGVRYKARVTRKEKNKILCRTFFWGMKTRCYETKWDRSGNYRADFFANNDSPYYCCYCGRKLRKRDVQVDHIIPVNAVKNNRGRILLRLFGIDNVNDPRNLVASCEECNRKKSDKMGLWVFRGWLGKHPACQVAVYVAELLIVVLVLAFATYFAKYFFCRFVGNAMK